MLTLVIVPVFSFSTSLAWSGMNMYFFVIFTSVIIFINLCFLTAFLNSLNFWLRRLETVMTVYISPLIGHLYQHTPLRECSIGGFVSVKVLLFPLLSLIQAF